MPHRVLVVDNASTDATPEICAAAAREDERIRFIRHQSNLGMTENFNYALRYVRDAGFRAQVGVGDHNLFIAATYAFTP